MTERPWPGNIQELQNFIERAVVLTKGECLEVPLQKLKVPRTGRSIKQTERSLNLRKLGREVIL